jgi:hypothetical protein
VAVIHLLITPEREAKTEMMMRALSRGLGGLPHRVIVGEPPDDGNPFVVWGQEWLTLRIVPEALRTGRPFWCIDNGYWQPARGTSRGYYRLTYRSMTTVQLAGDDLRLAIVPLKPWRKDGRHVLLAMPGQHFGAAMGIDVPAWCATIETRLRQATDRPIRIRPRDSRKPLDQDLAGAWCCVTHSSNIAVDAAIAGIPVFVEPTSAAAPIGRTDLEIEQPRMPGRKNWLRSLASQHFTIAEMASGEAWRWMARVAEQVDGNGSAQDRAA